MRRTPVVQGQVPTEDAAEAELGSAARGDAWRVGWATFRAATGSVGSALTVLALGWWAWVVTTTTPTAEERVVFLGAYLLPLRLAGEAFSVIVLARAATFVKRQLPQSRWPSRWVLFGFLGGVSAVLGYWLLACGAAVPMVIRESLPLAAHLRAHGLQFLSQAILGAVAFTLTLSSHPVIAVPGALLLRAGWFSSDWNPLRLLLPSYDLYLEHSGIHRVLSLDRGREALAFTGYALGLVSLALVLAVWRARRIAGSKVEPRYGLRW